MTCAFHNTLQFVNLLGWAVATISATACLYGIYDAVKPDNPVVLSKEVTALYNAVSRTVWGAAICWVIFACSTGNGGKIYLRNKSLSNERKVTQLFWEDGLHDFNYSYDCSIFIFWPICQQYDVPRWYWLQDTSTLCCRGKRLSPCLDSHTVPT